MVDIDEILRELRDRELLPAGSPCAFVSGSIVRGWGHGTSDLDIYVMSEERWTAETSDVVKRSGGEVPVHAFYVGERRWDIEYWQTAQVDNLIASVSWEAYDSGALDANVLSRHDIDLLDRMLYARPLFGAAWLDERRQAMKASALTTHLVSRQLTLTDIFVEDAVGQLQSGDLECAILAARMAFGHAVDALLADCGEIGHSTKWRPRRFHAVVQDVLSFEDYWRLETMATLDQRNPEPWVEEVLKVCRRIALKVTV